MKRVSLFLAASFALSVILVSRSITPGATLEETYTDSMRGAYSGWLFIQHGWDVYRIPLGELSARDPSVSGHAHWPRQPFIYPPGALLLYVPFGWAEYGVGVPEQTVHRAAVVLFVLLAHVSIWLFVRELRAGGQSLRLLPGSLYAMAALQFSLNGFHDPAYVAAAILGCGAARRGRADRSLFWLAVSSFLHFRALYFLPVALSQAVAFTGRAIDERPTRREWVAVGVALALASISGWTFLTTLMSLDDTAAVNLMREEGFGWGGTVVAAVATAAAAICLLRAREALTSWSLLWSAGLTLASPFSRAWHSLALYPLFALVPGEESKREVLLLWILVFGAIAFRTFPSLRFLARALGALF
jgi:hypothetical protein